MVIVSNLFLFVLPIYTASADSSILIDSTTYLYGNVRFSDNELQISSKTGIITKDRVIARDSVKILKEELEILTEFGEYLWNNKEIRLHNGFTAHKNYETLTGRECRYFENKLCVTDSIKYINNNENWVVCGEKGFYDVKTHLVMLFNSPKFESPKDSIEILGDTIKFFSDTLIKVIHNAIIKLSDTQCFAESLIYLPKAGIAWLYENPMIVSYADTLKGEKMKIILSDKKIERILVEGNVSGKRWKL